MRRLFLLVLLALLLGIGVVALIETDPGYVLVAYGNYTLETSFWVGLVLLVLVTLLLYGIVALLRRLAGGRKSLLGWIGSRRSHLASRLSTRGLISYIEGDWARARRDLLRGVRNNDAPLANYLLAAHASQRLGEPDKVREYLAAASSTAGAEVAAALTRAELALQAGEYQRVLGILKEVQGSAARQPRVLELQYQALRATGDWQALAPLLPELRKRRVLPLEELHRLQQEVYEGLLETDPGEPDAVQARWNALPAAVRREPAMIRRYAAGLLQSGAHAEAEKLLLGTLKHEWDPALVRLYGYVQSENVPRQLATAERWLQAHPEDTQLLLCLGRIAARDRLWGKAREYFESCYRRERSPEVCAELGRLLSGLGEAGVAAAYFREGLLLSENRLPALPLPDKALPAPGRRR